MSRLILPHAPNDTFGDDVLALGEIVVDETNKALRLGDGVTPGGILGSFDGDQIEELVNTAVAARNESVAAKDIVVADAAVIATTRTEVLTAAADAAQDAADAETAADQATAALAQVTAITGVSSTPFPNTYATNLPKGVLGTTSLVGGSGGADGTFALGFAGGSITGMEGTFTVEGGIVTDITITKRGLGTGTTPPTLDFTASAGLSGASATAVVGNLFGVMEHYWVAAADSKSIVLFFNNNVATPAPALNPDGSQISLPATNYLNSIAARLTPFEVAPAANSALNRILNLSMAGLDFSVGYYISSWLRDDFGAGGTPRIRLEIARQSDSVVVASLSGIAGGLGDGSGMAGIKTLILLPVGGSGASGLAVVDFGTDEGDGEGPAFNQEISTKLANWRIMFNAAQLTAVSAAATTAAKAESAKKDTCFIPTATDEYAIGFIKDCYIEGGYKNHDYIINYETIYFAGSDLYRIRLWLRDLTLNMDVAQRTILNTGPITYQPSQMLLYRDSLPNYTGIACMLWVDWSKILFTKSTTTYTTMAATGIRKDRILTKDMMDDFLVAAKPAVHLTVGPGTPTATHFNSLVDAVASTYRPDVGDITRSKYPISDVCSYSNQYLVEVVGDAYHEIVPNVVYSGTGQSVIVVPPFMTIRLKHDTIVESDVEGPADTAPVFERHRSSRLEFGTVINNGQGYCDHIDGFGATTLDASTGTMNNPVRTVSFGVNYKVPDGHNAPLIGSGISDGQTILIDTCRFIREGTESGYSYVLIHNVPIGFYPANIIIRNSYFNDAAVDGATGLLLLKTFDIDITHRVVIENTEIDSITAHTDHPGLPGYERRFPLGSITLLGNDTLAY
jgi:hypothetical protein